jgi:mannose PTS system EIIA component
MTTAILVVAHAPLASALQACVAHVFPDRLEGMRAIDVLAQDSAEQTLGRLTEAAATLGDAPLLVLTDIAGATPANVARRLLAQRAGTLVAGANVPMVMRAVTYQHEALPTLVGRVLDGGRQGVVELPPL